MSDREHPTDVSPEDADAMDYDGPDRDVKPEPATHVPPFTPLPGRVLTQLTHAQARLILDALPPESKRTADDKVSANVLGYALKQPEAKGDEGDWGYNATGPKP